MRTFLPVRIDWSSFSSDLYSANVVSIHDQSIERSIDRSTQEGKKLSSYYPSPCIRPSLAHGNKVHCMYYDFPFHIKLAQHDGGVDYTDYIFAH